MTVTRDVIMDLVPVCLSGDASADTRALVDGYLADHPEFAQWMAAQRAENFPSVDDSIPTDLERRTLVRVRRKLRSQRWLFGFACFFTAMILNVEYRTVNGRIVELQLVARHYPVPAIFCAIAAATCWTAYYVVRRRNGL